MPAYYFFPRRTWPTQYRDASKIYLIGLCTTWFAFACVTNTMEARAPSRSTRLAPSAFTITAPLFDQTEFVRRPCSPNDYEQQTGREPRPQIEAGVQSDGHFYMAGGCIP